MLIVHRNPERTASVCPCVSQFLNSALFDLETVFGLLISIPIINNIASHGKLNPTR
jgi:hypothetical protein